MELLLSVTTAAAVVALGLLLSTLTRSVRTAFALFAALTALFLAVRFGSELLSGVQVANNYSPLLFVRDMAIGLDQLLGLISPFTALENGVDAVVRSDPLPYVGALTISLLHCAVLLGRRLGPSAPRGAPMMRPARTLRTLLSFCWAAFAFAVLASPSQADVTNRERQFVYGLNVFTGTEYIGTFAPASVDTIYLLADKVGVLDPKVTEVYFWPITNDYRADWTALNELVPGTLEVLRDGGLVQRVELTDYVVQFGRARGIGNGRISLGAQAREHRAEFERERAAYLDRLRAYTDETELFNQRIDELRERGGDPTLLTPPAQPAPFTLYSSDLARGFPVQLAPGEYALQVRAQDGAIVAGSQKRLLAIARRRQGIGYEVVPQDKWTMPETADDPSKVIYVLPGGVVYLQPFVALEFNRLEYARLQNPQDLEATPNRWTWVHVAPIEGATLDADGRSIPLADYTVAQVPGGALGYSIVSWGPESATAASARSPDLRAFRVEAAGGRGAQTLQMVDASGRELAGSDRKLGTASGALDLALTLPILVPLALGAAAALWRRARVLTARSLSAEQRRLLA